MASEALSNSARRFPDHADAFRRCAERIEARTEGYGAAGDGFHIGADRSGIGAGSQNIGRQRPGAAQHDACERSAAEHRFRERLFRDDLSIIDCREITHAPVLYSHSPRVQNDSTLFLLRRSLPRGTRSSAAASRRGTEPSLRRLLVKCGLNAGGCKADGTGAKRRRSEPRSICLI